MKNTTAVVISYNEVEGFASGSHGNGRVTIYKLDTGKFANKEDTENEASGLRFQIAANILTDVTVTDAYIYIGEIVPNDARYRAFTAAINAVYSHIKDRSHIHLVGCCCGIEQKRAFCEHEGFDFIKSECGGRTTLGSIVRNLLKDVPKEEPAKVTLHFVEEFVLPNHKKKGCYNNVRTFASLGNVLLAGCEDGEVLWKKNGTWKKMPLVMDQCVNLIVPDGESVLVGDGSCCSGATFRLYLDGKFEQIIPVNGQGDGDGRNKNNIQGNVYGFARHGKELLTGGGGCAGTHIYRLNANGKWEYHPKDLNIYVIAMKTVSDGSTYVVTLGNDHSVYRYNGTKFQRLGHIPGVTREIFEHNGKIYIASTDSGGIQPSNFSNGYIHVVENNEVKLVWSGVGGAWGFFVHNGKLYAYGVNQSNWTGMLLRESNGKWEVIARFPEVLEFTCHENVVYAGGKKKFGEEDVRAAIFTVTGL